ncbi:MAG: hypothetical protein AB1486_00805 [Planctomycetota bacterium]
MTSLSVKRLTIVAATLLLLGGMGCGMKVTGTLVDEQGSPIAGARVFVMPRWGGRGMSFDACKLKVHGEGVRETLTDAKGHFSFSNLDTDDVVLVAGGEGGTAPVAKRVTGKDQGRDVRLQTIAGLTIQGRVFDATGTPASGLSLKVAADDVPTLKGETDERGFFSVGPVTRGHYDVVVPGTGEMVARGGERCLIIHLRESFELGGRIMTSDQKPVAGARVVLSRDSGPSQLFRAGTGRVLRGWDDVKSWSCESSVDGHFRFSNLARDRYRLFVSTNDTLAALLPRIDVPPAADHELIVVVEPGATLDVRNASNEGAEVRVRVQGMDVDSADLAAGDRCVFRVPPGRVEVAFTTLMPWLDIVRSVELAAGERKEIAFPAVDLASVVPGHKIQERDLPELILLVMDRIAAIRGRRFVSEVKGSFVDREALRRAWREDLRDIGSVQDMHSLELFLRHMELLREAVSLEEALRNKGNFFGGLYSASKKAFVSLGDSGPVHLMAVHEIAHALQDQYVDLQAFLAAGGSFDDYQARDALMEGEAYLLTELYATKFVPWPEQSREGVRFEFHREAAPEVLLARAIYRERGMAGLDEAFESPPTSTEQVRHPAKYIARVDPEVRVQPPELGGVLGAPWTLLLSDTFGEASIAKWGARFGDRSLSADLAAEGWGGDTFTFYRDEGSKRNLLVWWTTWDSEDDAREFFEMASERLGRVYNVDPLTAFPPHDERTVRRLEMEDRFAHLERRDQDVLVIDGALDDTIQLDHLVGAAWDIEKY